MSVLSSWLHNFNLRAIFTRKALNKIYNVCSNYIKDYGKPKEGEPVNYGGVILALIIIVFLTWLAFHFGVRYLSLLLVGEYKENYEIFRYLNEHRN